MPRIIQRRFMAKETFIRAYSPFQLAIRNMILLRGKLGRLGFWGERSYGRTEQCRLSE